jgi:glutathione S-transferase
MGVPYEAVLVDFRSQRESEYIAIIQKSRVPALATDSGTLTETRAPVLCGAAFPECGTRPFALAQVQDFNSYLCSAVHVAHAHSRRDARCADDIAAIEAVRVFRADRKISS